ncbi:uncharacterized protein ACMZJ9_011736 [Mantella aurantiaca]
MRGFRDELSPFGGGALMQAGVLLGWQRRRGAQETGTPVSITVDTRGPEWMARQVVQLQTHVKCRRKAVVDQMNDSDSDLELLAELSDSKSWVNSSSDTDTDETRDDSDDSAKLSDVQSWCSIDCGTDQAAPPRFPFSGVPGMKVDVEHNNPLAYLKLFLTDEVIEKIVTETNRYKEQQSATLYRKFSRSRKWEPVTKDDIWTFLGLIILQGVVRKPLQKWYWSTNKLLETPFFGTVMTEYRFSLIMKFLHFTNNEEFDETTHPAPKLRKIWEVFQMVVKNFQQTYVPERDISIDESLMAYKGRLSRIQYIASKRARFGIKSYMLCESSTGYIWNSGLPPPLGMWHIAPGAISFCGAPIHVCIPPGHRAVALAFHASRCCRCGIRFSMAATSLIEAAVLSQQSPGPHIVALNELH